MGSLYRRSRSHAADGTLATTTGLPSALVVGGFRRGAKRVAHSLRAARAALAIGRLEWSPLDERWEGLRPTGLFDASWYRAAYPDVRAIDDLLRHYALVGWREGRDPNPMFSTSWYLTTYPDIAATGMNPLLHYFEDGAAEGRDPGPEFDTSWYLRSNADVRSSGLNPLAHYLSSGLAEGRRAQPLSARTAATSAVVVVLVSGEPTTPGHRYRVTSVADAVRRTGGEATVLTIPEAAGARHALLAEADVVVLWRAAWCEEVERIVLSARRSGASVVFDVDDVMVDPSLAVNAVIDGIRSQGLTEDEAGEWFGQIARTASEADACTATTSEIAVALRRLGKPVHVLPNGFDDETLMAARLARRVRTASVQDGRCRLGYAAGSLTHQRDFAVMAEPLADVLRTHPDALLVLFKGALDLDEFPAFDDLRDQIEWRPIVPLDDLPSEIARFDINLAPLEVGNPFCEGKSALKFFEAALVDVPTVASPTEPYRAVMIHGHNGFLADDAGAWRAAVGRLVEDAALRTSIGRAARRSVLWPLGPERRAQMVRSVLDQVLRGDGGPDAFELELIRSARDVPEPELAPVDVLFEHDRVVSSPITVVVPLHDYSDVVVSALESVRDQTLTDLDLVVVDDQSTDGSDEVVLRWLSANATRFNRAVMLRHRHNAGVAVARNAGFDAAETPYVLPLDADNVLLPRCCEVLLDTLESSSAAFAYPRIRHFGSGTELFAAGDVRGYLPYAPQLLVRSNYIDAMALVRKGAWAGAGGYRPGTGWEDYDLWCRFAEIGLAGIHVDEELAQYRVHETSMLHTVTHQGAILDATRNQIEHDHPWLALDGPSGESSSTVATTIEIPRPRDVPHHLARRKESAAPPPSTGSRLSERSRELLALLRCPETGEPLEEDAHGGLRSVPSGRRWPIVDGLPCFLPDADQVAMFSPEHRGNPLPARARALAASCDGPVLHLSGGGTVVGSPRAVEFDAARFGATDVLGDAHHLPFGDAQFDVVIVMNAFEHYREPPRVVQEIDRVLRPDGLVFVHTAFLQPVHEAPRHYFNSTRYGVEQWFAPFETVDLRVSDNFHPGYTFAWLASEAEVVVGEDHSADAVELLRGATIGRFADLWRDPEKRADDPYWTMLEQLREASRERLAAGFEYLGRKHS